MTSKCLLSLVGECEKSVDSQSLLVNILVASQSTSGNLTSNRQETISQRTYLRMDFNFESMGLNFTVMFGGRSTAGCLFDEVLLFSKEIFNVRDKLQVQNLRIIQITRIIIFHKD